MNLQELFLWLRSFSSLSGSVVVLKDIAHTALMMQTYIVTEKNNNEVIVKNESVKELVAKLSDAIKSGKKELESVEVLKHCLPFTKRMILSVGRFEYISHAFCWKASTDWIFFRYVYQNSNFKFLENSCKSKTTPHIVGVSNEFNTPWTSEHLDLTV